MLNVLVCFKKRQQNPKILLLELEITSFFIFIDCKLARTGPPATIVPIDEESRNGECTSVFRDTPSVPPRWLVRALEAHVGSGMSGWQRGPLCFGSEVCSLNLSTGIAGGKGTVIQNAETCHFFLKITHFDDFGL